MSILSPHHPLMDPLPADRRLIDEALRLYARLANIREIARHVRNFAGHAGREFKVNQLLELIESSDDVLQRIRGEVKP